jgi:hypothetical protein
MVTPSYRNGQLYGPPGIAPRAAAGAASGNVSTSPSLDSRTGGLEIDMSSEGTASPGPVHPFPLARGPGSGLPRWACQGGIEQVERQAPPAILR